MMSKVLQWYERFVRVFGVSIVACFHHFQVADVSYMLQPARVARLSQSQTTQAETDDCSAEC